MGTRHIISTSKRNGFLSEVPGIPKIRSGQVKTNVRSLSGLRRRDEQGCVQGLFAGAVSIGRLK
jgi:hypothetical protein